MLTLKSTVALLLIGCNMWYFKIGVGQNLSLSAQESNATEIYNYCMNDGFTIQATCALLGNIQRESSLNPGKKQGENLAWGLIQWDPHTVLTDWASENGYNWWDGAAQMIFITGDDVVHWHEKPQFPYSYEDFKQMTDIDLATEVYKENRERNSLQDLDLRQTYAWNWYYHFTDQPVPPQPPTPPRPPQPTPPTTRKGMPFWMYLRPNYYF